MGNRQRHVAGLDRHRRGLVEGRNEDSVVEERREAQVRTVLNDTAAAASAELIRVDSKVGILLGWACAAMAVITTATTGRHLAVDVAVLVWASDGTLAVSVALLLGTIRPNLRAGGGGWLHYVGLEAAEVLDYARTTGHPIAATEHTAQRAGTLARLAFAKFRRLRLAVDLIYVSGVLMTAALVLAGVS